MLRRSFLRAAPMTVPIKPNKEFCVHEAGHKNLPPLNDTIELDSEKPVKFLEMMLRMRRMELTCDQQYKMKKIRGFCHLYIGQEAIAVGMEDVLDYNDSVITGYRDHCWHLTRGGTPYEVLAEMMWKKTGCSKGKGGSMHMYNTKNNWWGGNGIVGAQVPLGAGLAWKCSLMNGVKTPKHVAVTLYGDGAANQGQISETMNMCALWKVPCIFVCENNHFGMGTADSRASASVEFYKRSLNIPGIRVDGMNVFSVIEGTRWAKDWCLKGNGPVLLEMDSYRYRGHSMSDPDSAYRTPDDIKKVRDERDCVVHMKKFIEQNKLATAEEIAALEKRVQTEIKEDLKKALADPFTGMEEMHTDVLVNQKEYGPIRSCQGTVFIENK